LRRAAFGLKSNMFFAGKGFPAGEWNGYYQQASSFGDKGQLVRGAPLKPHMKGWILYARIAVFLIGFLLGGLLGITVMCLVQINRVRKEERHESQEY